jgi:hypothetical protein
MTRRSLLAAGAGAIAGGMVRPDGALSATVAALIGSPPRPVLQEHPLGRVPAGITTVALNRVADLVGVQWHAPANANIELRFRDAGGSWSRWASAGSHGHGPETPAVTGGHVGDPVWTGGTTALQLRVRTTLTDVRLQLVDVSGGTGAARLAASVASLGSSAAALPLATPVLAAGPGQPPIIARRAWAEGVSPPRVAPEYGALRMAFVHHTDNPNGYGQGEVPAMIRAIYVFHRYVNGWNDIGYNFVIDLYGRIFEARAGGIDEPVVGAHAGGYNLMSTGVAVLGTFMSEVPSTSARSALEQLLAWKLSLHGLPAEGVVNVRVNPAGAVYSRFPANALVTLPRISGHRDADTTDCPGDVLYSELASIRRRVHSLAPRPTSVSLTLGTALAAAPGSTTPGAQPTPAPAGAEPSPEAPPTEVPTLLGAVQFLDGTPIAGAPILLQARAVSSRGEVVEERTIAETVSDAQGAWSLPAAFSSARGGWVWLRALCPSSSAFGAAVSQPLRVRVTALPGAPAVPEPTPTGAVPPAT